MIVRLPWLEPQPNGDVMARRIPTQLRREVTSRARTLCEYCLLPQQLFPAIHEVDHIIPVVDGGKTDSSKLCLACRSCNAAKRGYSAGADPQTGKRVKLFNPRIQSWSRHFAWASSDGQINGRTAVGRATLVEAGIRFVTVEFNGYYTHDKNFIELRQPLLPKLDAAYSALLDDLAERGMLKNTLVICMGDFGRTPRSMDWLAVIIIPKSTVSVSAVLA